MLELLAQTTQPDQVRAFYTDAFYAVLTVVVIMVAIFGFAVPFIAGLLQRRSSAKELEQLRQKVSQEMAADRERLLAEVHQKMNADQEKMLQNVRQKMNLDMGKTCQWIALNAVNLYPEYSLMMDLHATTYYILAGDTTSATGSVGGAGYGLQRILRRPAFKGLTMKSSLNAALNTLKEAVDSERMNEAFDEQIARIEKAIQEVEPREVGPIEKAIQGAEPREDNGGAG